MSLQKRKTPDIKNVEVLKKLIDWIERNAAILEKHPNKPMDGTARNAWWRRELTIKLSIKAFITIMKRVPSSKLEKILTRELRK